MSVQVKDVDRGWKKFQAEMKEAEKKPHAVVGIWGKKADKMHAGSKLPNITIATAHEFGTTIAHPGGTAYYVQRGKGAKFVSNVTAENLPRELKRTAPHDIEIPERSFIRNTVDLKAAEIQKTMEKQVALISVGKVTTEGVLRRLGLFVKGLIQERMAQGIAPGLKRATIERKGSSKPLIDTGQLRSSIAYEVRKGEK